MRIVKVECDKCGKRQDMETGYRKYRPEPPKDWSKVKGNDLCENCYEKYEEKVQEFVGE